MYQIDNKLDHILANSLFLLIFKLFALLKVSLGSSAKSYSVRLTLVFVLQTISL